MRVRKFALTQYWRPRSAGVLRTGDRLVAHIAQFAETRNGLISSIETFDCYEQGTPATASGSGEGGL